MHGRYIDRREFMGLTTAGIAGGVLSLGSSLPAFAGQPQWDPNRPQMVAGKAIRVQPVLMYRVSEERKASSWKSWGGVQSEEAASAEAERISQELKALAGSANAGFSMDVHPVVKVRTAAEAQRVHEVDYDVVVVYAASGSGDLLRACFAQDKARDTIVFVRRQSGPSYYWHEALSTKYLVKRGSDISNNTRLNHGDVHVDDVVVDDGEELLWRLRALYGLKNFIGARIVALGGPWGKYSPEAPRVAQNKYGLEIVGLPYDEVAPRIEAARKDAELAARAKKWSAEYLGLPHTELATSMKFVVNSFVLYDVFRDLMREHDAPAFTIKDCMSKILPIAETTPCLTLSLINDAGLMAFCESDFVVIPCGILLHYISGKPVFLHNSTFPHNGICTCAHCSAPRRLDGKRYEPAKIMTHYESEYGAAPKVEMPKGQELTFINPEYSTGRWVGFEGVVKDNPFREICRTQQDVEVRGDWKKLLNEVRDSHWMMSYGTCLREVGYAARKIGIDWTNISQA